MKKHVTKLALLLLLVLVFMTGCSKGSKEVTIDVAKLADELQSQTVTSDSLVETTTEILQSTYFVESDQMENGVAYMSSVSTPCEVAVIECKKADQTADVEKLFKTRVENQSTLFSSYKPEEVTKLDNAIIKTAGKYVVLCVCDDTDKAEEILKNYGI